MSAVGVTSLNRARQRVEQFQGHLLLANQAGMGERKAESQVFNVESYGHRQLSNLESAA
jgi:hypothetical protein